MLKSVSAQEIRHGKKLVSYRYFDYSFCQIKVLVQFCCFRLIFHQAGFCFVRERAMFVPVVALA